MRTQRTHMHTYSVIVHVCMVRTTPNVRVVRSEQCACYAYAQCAYCACFTQARAYACLPKLCVSHACAHAYARTYACMYFFAPASAPALGPSRVTQSFHFFFFALHDYHFGFQDFFAKIVVNTTKKVKKIMKSRSQNKKNRHGFY